MSTETRAEPINDLDSRLKAESDQREKTRETILEELSILTTGGIHCFLGSLSYQAVPDFMPTAKEQAAACAIRAAIKRGIETVTAMNEDLKAKGHPTEFLYLKSK